MATRGVHRSTASPLCGSSAQGVESVLLGGDYFHYAETKRGYIAAETRHLGPLSLATGDGLIHGNAATALIVSQIEGLPIRVIIEATRDRFVYQGIFRVDYHWMHAREGRAATTSYLLERWPERHGSFEQQSVDRIQRIVRSSAAGEWVKRIYAYACQVCGARMLVHGGIYAEVMHIRPLGAPHSGTDTSDNILCLCPNHHVSLSLGAQIVLPDHTICDMPGKTPVSRLRVSTKHDVAKSNLAYRAALLWGPSRARR